MIAARTQATRPLTHAEVTEIEAQSDLDLLQVQALEGCLERVRRRAYSNRGLARIIREEGLHYFTDSPEFVARLRAGVGFVDEQLDAVHHAVKEISKPSASAPASQLH